MSFLRFISEIFVPFGKKLSGYSEPDEEIVMRTCFD